MNTTSEARPGCRGRQPHLRDPAGRRQLCPDRAARPVLLGRRRRAAVRVRGRASASPATADPSGSGPMVVGGKVYMVGDGGKLYCVDPATNLPCATPAIPTGLLPDLGGRYDITSHGSRVYVSRVRRQGGLHRRERRRRVPRLGAAQAAAGRSLERREPASTRRARRRACASSRAARASATTTPIRPRRRRSAGCRRPDSFAPDTEAETGSRTLVADGGSGVDCWDWIDARSVHRRRL